MAWFEHDTSKIYYEELGSGDVVLLLPGLTDSIEGHTVLRETLAAAGYRVIAADLPGSGCSLPQPRTYTASYYEDDARSFAALLNHLGAAPAHLMGFSDGGEYGLLMAEMWPDRVRSVVTWGSMGQVSDPTGMLRQFLYNVVDNPPPPMQGFRDYLVATYGEANARAATQSAAQAFAEIIDQHGGDLSLAKADTIACPVLLIRGEHDWFVSRELLNQLAARIRHVDVLEVEGAEHDAHNTRAAWFAQTVVGWLKQHENVAQNTARA